MKMINTYKFLEETEIKVIKQMQDILMKHKRNASHRLYNSFEGEVIESKNGFIFKINYADHGAFVLDNKRNVRKQKPSKTAIDSIMSWILDKGVSIGKGKIRTPLKKESSKTGLEPASRAYSKTNERRNFAFAIWYNIKKNRRTKAPATNFLKPYNNLFKSKDFTKGITESLSQDGIVFLGKDAKTGEIKINM